MKYPLFDSHAHLTFADFEADLGDVLERAKAAGVEGIVTVGAGGGPDVFRAARQLAARHEGLWATAGLHPHDARFGSPALWSELAEVARQPDVVAVGEIGLDYHYNFSSPEAQREAFAAQLRLAREVDKPIIIHSREADDDTIALIEQEGLGSAGGVVHCFSGGSGFAARVVEAGLHVSFSGIVTFPSAKEVAEAVAVVPDHLLLVETDCPFLAPPPHRGRRNEPAHVALVAQRLAKLRGLTVDDVARITTHNARQLYGLDSGARAPIVYPIRDQLYINITNRCTLGCVFCPKRRDWLVKGHLLRHHQEPSEAEVRAALSQATADHYREVVFCGLGEPTLRLELVLALGRELRQRGIATRLDTDGLASLREGREVTGELAEAFDAVSVSLNAADGETYARLCPSKHGSRAWQAACDFLRRARPLFRQVTASAVAVPGLDVEAVRRLVEQDIGVQFRVRAYNVVG
jgi:TatD DNase family protein